MKKFRLEPCLKVRRHREECEEIRLGELLRELQELNQRLGATREAVVRNRSELSLRKELPASEALQYEYYFHSQALRILELLRERERLQSAIAEQKQTLIEASRARKVVERLEERFVEKQRSEEDQQLQMQLDELHLLGLVRRNSQDDTVG
jgi:flagellar export protein FliJ